MDEWYRVEAHEYLGDDITELRYYLIFTSSREAASIAVNQKLDNAHVVKVEPYEWED